MVPYFATTTVDLGGHAVPVFGPLVVFGLGVGIAVAMHHARRIGLVRSVAADIIWHAVIVGFLVAHAFDVIAYHPERVLADPLELLRFWGTMSSFGGIIGGLCGTLFYFARAGRDLSFWQRIAYLDTIAYGFPFAWIFGRLACTIVFDHPGTITRFPLASSLETDEARMFATRVYEHAGALDRLPPHDDLVVYGLHNLGFYEFLYTVAVIVPTFLVLATKPRAPGFFLVAFFVVYAPIRFLLDFARMGDARYFGFTPGQYAAVFVFVASLWLASKMDRRRTA